MRIKSLKWFVIIAALSSLSSCNLGTPVTAATVPGVPLEVTAFPGNGEVQVFWSAPTSNGGSAITGYTVTVLEDSSLQCQTSGTLSCTVTGLVNSQTYSFVVRAVNSVGVSIPSVPLVMLLPGDPVWTQRNSGTTAVLYDVIWTGTQLMAVGKINTSGIILTSPDGIRWSQRFMGARGFDQVIWTGSLFVTSGGSEIVTSPDGVTWTLRVSGLQNRMRLVWAGNQVVGVGGVGTVLRSPDGISWTTRTVVTPGFLYNVAWTGNLLVAIGELGAILTSPDGVTWTPRASGTTATLAGIVWTGSQVAVMGAPGVVLTSPDGVTWTGSPLESASIPAEKANRIFFVPPNDNGPRSLVYMWSGNGIISLNAGGAVQLYSAVWAGTRAVAVGSGGTIMTLP